MVTKLLAGNFGSIWLLFALVSFFGGGEDVISVRAQSLPLVLQRDVSLSPRNRKDFEALITKYKAAICFEVAAGCAVNTSVAKQARDGLIYATISQIDINFTKHERGRRHRKEMFETLMDFLKLGADTAAVITNGARAKTIISAGSGLVQLLRESTEKNLRLKETEIIFNRMEADRARALTRILGNLRGDPDALPRPVIQKGVDEYPFEAAWIDLVAYYRAGTVDSALAALAAATADDKRISEKRVETLRTQ